MRDVLEDQTPRFSVRSVIVIVVMAASVVTGYVALQTQVSDHQALIHDVPDRIRRLELLMCYTDDATRVAKCRQLGILP